MMGWLTLAKLAGAFIKENWKLLLIAAALVAAGFWIRSYGKAQCERCRAQIMSELQEQLDKANARVAAAEALADQISRQKDIEFQEERNALRDQIAELQSRREPVRLCRPAPGRVEAAGVPGAATEPDAADGRGEHGLQAGPDIGDDLVRYAGECEGYRQQVNALQDWITAQRAAASQ